MKSTLLTTLCIIVALFLTSCENSYKRASYSNSPQPSSNSSEGNLIGLSKDAYQVTEGEYDNFFVSRYGLLHQKFSDTPFSGRIIMISSGENGEYVSSDETWNEGKKDGVSTRWFSNGIKMYERNYNQGKWHGTVTRWWPNGQKMYVRAYSNGKKHGKEATWRSDGTPIELSGGADNEVVSPAPSVETPVAEPSTDLDSPLPGISLPSAEPSFPDTPEAPAGDSLTTELPSFDPIPAPESAPEPALICQYFLPQLPNHYQQLRNPPLSQLLPKLLHQVFPPIPYRIYPVYLRNPQVFLKLQLNLQPFLPCRKQHLLPMVFPLYRESTRQLHHQMPYHHCLVVPEMLSHPWMICLAYPCLRKAHQVMIYHHFLDFLENLPEICLHYLEQERMTYHLFPLFPETNRFN